MDKQDHFSEAVKEKLKDSKYWYGKRTDMQHRTKTAQEFAEEIKTGLADIEELEIGVSYEYPTWDRLQIQFDPV